MHQIDLAYAGHGIHEELVAYVADQEGYYEDEHVLPEGSHARVTGARIHIPSAGEVHDFTQRHPSTFTSQEMAQDIDFRHKRGLLSEINKVADQADADAKLLEESKKKRRVDVEPVEMPKGMAPSTPTPHRPTTPGETVAPGTETNPNAPATPPTPPEVSPPPRQPPIR